MSEYAVFIDRNRYTYLQYRDAGKTRHFVSLHTGSIDCVQLEAKDFLRLRPYTERTPEHFAKIYLSSFLSISRSARAILRAVLGQSDDLGATEQRASFNSGVVSLPEILEGMSLTPQEARKYLRKLVEKPGGRWAWEPEGAEKIRVMLKEFEHANSDR